MSRADGGLAFPTHGGHSTDRFVDDPRNQILGGGMSLRDYFAAKAMAANIGTRHADYQGENGPDVLAEDAYIVADAMLKAREMAS